LKLAGESPATPSATGLAAELEFRSHFANKRNGTRTSIAIEVVIRGRAGRFPGCSIDISRSGILLQITDRVYVPPSGDLAAFAAKIEQHFKTGADIRFVEHGFASRAEIVRVTHGQDADAQPFLIACRFRRPLTEVQCVALGIDLTDERDFEASATAPPPPYGAR
jgi:hypothetical protein